MATGNSQRNVGWLVLATVGLAAGNFACDGNKAPQAFSAFELCLLGEPPKDDADLSVRLRALELSLRRAPAQTTAQDWPNRCAPYADALLAALGSSSSDTMLRKELINQLSCVVDQPGSCKFPEEGAVLPTPVSLWQAAKVQGIERVAVEGVPAPKPAGEGPLLTAGWPKLAEAGWGLLDTHQTPRGETWMLFRAAEGRVPVRFCQLLATGDAKSSLGLAACSGPHASVPSLPLQSVMLVDHDAEPALAGLTEEGRRGYLLKSGESMAVAGYPGSEVSVGLAVERGENDEGYEVYPMSPQKKGDAIQVKADGLVHGPLTVGPFVVWVEKGEAGGSVVVSRAQGRVLREVSRQPGAFAASELKVCRTPTGYALAAFGRSKGQQEAKPTAGADGTQVSVTFLDQEKAELSPVVTGTIPFDRNAESPASCTDGSWSLAWAKGRSASPSAGSLVCTSVGCKSSQSTWASLGVQAFAGVAPLAGGKVGVIYRTSLGDLRSLVGDAGALDQATPRTLLDDEEHGGPMIGDPQVLVSPGALVLLFKDEAGFLGLRVGADGEARPLPVK